jgi:hypothetical protein
MKEIPSREFQEIKHEDNEGVIMMNTLINFEDECT